MPHGFKHPAIAREVFSFTLVLDSIREVSRKEFPVPSLVRHRYSFDATRWVRYLGDNVAVQQAPDFLLKFREHLVRIHGLKLSFPRVMGN